LSAPAPQHPRVLHVITILSVGGVEVWLTALLRHIQSLERDRLPHETFDILMTGGKRGDLDDIAASLGATLHYLPFSRRNLPAFAGSFRKLLRERKYSAIHDHQDYSAGWHFLAGAGELPPIRIVHVHNPPARLRVESRSALRRMGLRVSSRLVRRFATHVLGTSSQILEQYGFKRKQFPRQSIRTLHCGFEVADFNESFDEANRSVCDELGWPHPTKLALFVGRLDGFDPSRPGWNHKNPQFALEVARLALERDPDLRFVMVGGGGDVQAQLESKVREWGLSDRTCLVGRRLDVARFMAAAHTLIFPSLEEGLGMVAVEAQAAGLHVLASDAVPREAVVLPELVKFLPLSAGAETWCTELLKQLSMPRYDASIAAEKVKRSPYSVAESYRRLHSIYGSADDAA
jgi:glycosyltransferase involved in cell wall biosynthesis